MKTFTKFRLWLTACLISLFEPLYVSLTHWMAREGLIAFATIGGTALTYADWAKRIDENGKVAVIINLLSQTNELLDDMLVVEGNLPTGHKTTVRTGLPTAAWRLLNYGVPKAKSTTAQITDNCGMLEVYSEVDKDLADLNGNTAEFRLSEDLAFLEGMNQQMASAFAYSNSLSTPAQIMGFAPRFNATATATAQTAANVIDAGGTGSTNTSIWVVTWGPNTVHGIFPKGKMSGLQHRDLGEWPLADENGNLYQGYRTHFKWDTGLTVRDWRYVVRICNIDVSLLSGASAANLINALIRAVHRMPTAPSTVSTEQKSDVPGGMMMMGRTVIYCNRTIRTYLDIQAVNKTNALLRFEEWHGKPVTTFRGVPIRTVDSILSNETRIV